jgi:hypothetical protein
MTNEKKRNSNPVYNRPDIKLNNVLLLYFCIIVIDILQYISYNEINSIIL